MPQRIPGEAQDLVLRHIHSVAQLEVLLHVRTHGDSGQTAEEVGREQKIGSEMASDLLHDLERRGFLTRKDGTFVYSPKAQLARQVDVLAGAYSTYRVAIINLIFSRPTEGVQSFADAFRVRRDEE